MSFVASSIEEPGYINNYKKVEISSRTEVMVQDDDIFMMDDETDTHLGRKYIKEDEVLLAESNIIHDEECSLPYKHEPESPIPFNIQVKYYVPHYHQPQGLSRSLVNSEVKFDDSDVYDNADKAQEEQAENLFLNQRISDLIIKDNFYSSSAPKVVHFVACHKSDTISSVITSTDKAAEGDTSTVKSPINTQHQTSDACPETCTNNSTSDHKQRKKKAKRAQQNQKRRAAKAAKAAFSTQIECTAKKNPIDNTPDNVSCEPDNKPSQEKNGSHHAVSTVIFSIKGNSIIDKPSRVDTSDSLSSQKNATLDADSVPTNKKRRRRGRKNKKTSINVNVNENNIDGGNSDNPCWNPTTGDPYSATTLREFDTPAYSYQANNDFEEWTELADKNYGCYSHGEYQDINDCKRQEQDINMTPSSTVSDTWDSTQTVYSPTTVSVDGTYSRHQVDYEKTDTSLFVPFYNAPFISPTGALYMPCRPFNTIKMKKSKHLEPLNYPESFSNCITMLKVSNLSSDIKFKDVQNHFFDECVLYIRYIRTVRAAYITYATPKDMLVACDKFHQTVICHSVILCRPSYFGELEFDSIIHNQKLQSFPYRNDTSKFDTFIPTYKPSKKHRHKKNKNKNKSSVLFD
ncbi:hypothetical protein BDB01DRAFT_905513 [Pilobolus umbonatus]|nr:hypothetical protein BDB01DRAFT_905513 [Pilobolus umbonatus]